MKPTLAQFVKIKKRVITQAEGFGNIYYLKLYTKRIYALMINITLSLHSTTYIQHFLRAFSSINTTQLY